MFVKVYHIIYSWKFLRDKNFEVFADFDHDLIPHEI